ILLILCCCSETELIIDDGDGINLKFIDGLNDNPQYSLSKDQNGYYELVLDRTTNQTIQRITAKLTRNGMPVEDISSGKQPKKVEWESNLYWWLLEGDTVANITKTYFNKFTGELTYVNLPPLTNWKDVLVPTVNSSSYTNEQTGIVNTVIAPIQKMANDTMKVTVLYNHIITSKQDDSNYFEILGNRIFKDSVYIVLK
ncbi:MAG: hypothetical protein VW905_02570, partial [Gammaproteobacteria bacterium]